MTLCLSLTKSPLFAHLKYKQLPCLFSCFNFLTSQTDLLFWRFMFLKQFLIMRTVAEWQFSDICRSYLALPRKGRISRSLAPFPVFILYTSTFSFGFSYNFKITFNELLSFPRIAFFCVTSSEHCYKDILCHFYRFKSPSLHPYSKYKKKFTPTQIFFKHCSFTEQTPVSI